MFSAPQEIVKYLIAVAVQDKQLPMRRSIIQASWMQPALEYIKRKGLKRNAEKRQSFVWLLSDFPISPPTVFYTPTKQEYEDDADMIQDMIQILFILYSNNESVYSPIFGTSEAVFFTDAHTDLSTGFAKCSFMMRMIPDILSSIQRLKTDIECEVPLSTEKFRMSLKEARNLYRVLNDVNMQKLEALDPGLALRTAEAVHDYLMKHFLLMDIEDFDIRSLALLKYCLKKEVSSYEQKA